MKEPELSMVVARLQISELESEGKIDPEESRKIQGNITRAMRAMRLLPKADGGSLAALRIIKAVAGEFV